MIGVVPDVVLLADDLADELFSIILLLCKHVVSIANFFVPLSTKVVARKNYKHIYKFLCSNFFDCNLERHTI